MTEAVCARLTMPATVFLLSPSSRPTVSQLRLSLSSPAPEPAGTRACGSPSGESPTGTARRSLLPGFDGRPVLRTPVYLARALDASRRRGETVPDALLAHIAPLGWQHINLTGDYLWDADAAVGPHGFRPLRGAEMLSAEAA